MQEIKFSPLIEENKIQKRVQELGKQITKDYEGKDLVCICVLNGAFMFFSDLIREIDCDFKCDFLGLSSYQGTQSQGCLLYTSPSPRDKRQSRMPSSA